MWALGRDMEVSLATGLPNLLIFGSLHMVTGTLRLGMAK